MKRRSYQSTKTTSLGQGVFFEGQLRLVPLEPLLPAAPLLFHPTSIPYRNGYLSTIKYLGPTLKNY